MDKKSNRAVYAQIINSVDTSPVERQELVALACQYVHKDYSAEKAIADRTVYIHGFYTNVEIEEAIVREVAKCLEVFSYPVAAHATVVLARGKTFEDFKAALQMGWVRNPFSKGIPFSMVGALEVKPQSHRQELIGNGKEFRTDGVHYEVCIIFDAGSKEMAGVCIEQLEEIALRQVGHSLLDNEAAFKFGDKYGRNSRGNPMMHFIADSKLALLNGIHHFGYTAKDDPKQKQTKEYLDLLDDGLNPYVTTETKRGGRGVLAPKVMRTINRHIKKTSRPKRPTA